MNDQQTQNEEIDYFFDHTPPHSLFFRRDTAVAKVRAFFDRELIEVAYDIFCGVACTVIAAIFCGCLIAAIAEPFIVHN